MAGDDAREVARRDVRYCGKTRDDATGLYAYPYRSYAPWLGRWLSPDPIGPADDLNLYQFVGGDPIGFVDPLGTDRRQTDPPTTQWVWAFDDDGNPTSPYFWNGAAWEQAPGAEPSEVIEMEGGAPDPNAQPAPGERPLATRAELLDIFHAVEDQQRHLDAANELARLAISKWGNGKYVRAA